MKTLLTLLLLTLGQSFAAETAIYRITFKSLWNAADHVSFPGNAHFSDIVAINHTSIFKLFSLGQKVTSGMEDLAEVGRTTGIINEINQAQMANLVENLEIAPALFPQRDGDTLTFDIEVSKNAPLLSFATMIAPSPDWIVGLDALELVKGGVFVKSLSLDLIAIDAGTEEGDFAGNFSTNNRASTPQRSSRLLDHISGLDLPFATVVIEKL